MPARLLVLGRVCQGARRQGQACCDAVQRRAGHFCTAARRRIQACARDQGGVCRVAGVRDCGMFWRERFGEREVWGERGLGRERERERVCMCERENVCVCVYVCPSCSGEIALSLLCPITNTPLPTFSSSRPFPLRPLLPPPLIRACAICGLRRCCTTSPAASKTSRRKRRRQRASVVVAGTLMEAQRAGSHPG